MIVSQAMSKKVDYVFAKSKVGDISKLIFIHHINGVPVLKGKKVIGFITERDILAKFFPSVHEYMQDPVNTSNFEKMEKKISEIFDLTADKIMNRGAVTIDSDAPLLRAQSLMLTHKIGRLPVIDKKGNLIGIISKGDIFKALVGDRLTKK